MSTTLVDAIRQSPPDLMGYSIPAAIDFKAGWNAKGVQVWGAAVAAGAIVTPDIAARAA